jgi:large subunit ribosomal protein L9
VRIVLVEDVENVGLAGDVKEVKNGYARNFLIPRGMAVKATKNDMLRIESLRKAAEVKRQKYASEMEVLATQIEGQSVTLQAKVGPTGRLYGSITSQMIADAVNKLTGQQISHRRVALSAPLRDLGDHPVTLRLAQDVSADIVVTVEPEGGMPVLAPLAADLRGQPAAVEAQPVDESVAEEEPANQEK